MHEIANEMNKTLQENSPTFYYMLSDFGKNIYMPKGIILQSAEAKKFATKYDATIGIAKEKGEPMYLKSITKYFNDLTPSQIFPYAPPHGMPDLRKKWKEKIVKENNNLKNINAISNPIVTQALTNGLMLAGDLFINEGDEILLPDMLWENYILMYELRYKAVIKTYSFFNKELTGFNLEAFENAIKNSKKEKIIILLNFPNNPTGYTPSEKEADEIHKITLNYANKGKKILVICDDAYYGLLYENNLIQGSIFSKFVGAHENIVSLKIDGYTKEFYVWGFRVGFITFGDYWHKPEAYSVLEDKTAACIRSSISNCSQTMQSVLLKAESSTEYIKEREEKYNILKARALKVKAVVYDKKFSDCWDVYPFNSGYFMCIRIKGVDSELVRQYALKEYGVGTIALGDHDLRIAFSCVEVEQIEDIFNIIALCIRKLQNK